LLYQLMLYSMSNGLCLGDAIATSFCARDGVRQQ